MTVPLAQPATVGGEQDDAGGEAELVAAETVSAVASFGGQFGFALPNYLAGGVDLYAGRVAPRVALGARVPRGGGWRIGIEVATGAVGEREGGPTCEPGPPDLAAHGAALADTVRRFVADAVAAYGSVYRDLRNRTPVVARRDGCRWRRTGLRY